MAEPILIGKGGTTAVQILPRMANRHGLIAGATGTGKTVTLQRLAESFSCAGVPVPLGLKVQIDLRGVRPQAVEVVEFPGFSLEHVENDVAVIQE